MILHDLVCTQCGLIMEDVAVEGGDYGTCVACGSTRTWVPAKINTDVYGCPTFSDATGQEHSSQHEKEMEMAKWGYYPAGDKVGGARHEHRIKGTAFCYPGQKSHVSTGESQKA